MRTYTKSGKTYGTIQDRTLVKRIVESKHLLWSKGGVPCFDADMLTVAADDIDSLKVITDKKRTFTISLPEFEKHMQEINFGYGVQYFVPKEYWDITQQ